MLKLPDLREANVDGKKVFLRLDLDVPIDDGQILDDSRLLAGLPTIELLLKSKAKIIIAGHLGRPQHENQESRIKNKEFSLEPIASWFKEELMIPNSQFIIQKIGEFDAWKIAESITLLENLRFFKEEGHNDPVFSEKLAKLAEIYVNDAFAASHRSHASIVSVPKLLPHYAGLRLQKEVAELSKVLENPQRPLVVIIGGAKIETKLPLVEKMHNLADYVLVGGEIASKETILSKIQHEKAKAITIIADLNQDGTDITEKSLENFLQFIERAKTTVWNGPMGKVPEHEESSKAIAEGIIQSSSFNIIGGGDTVSLIKKLGLLDKFSFVSTGGGAMLEFLSGSKLPGIEALTH